MNSKRSALSAFLTLLISVLVLFASLKGIFDEKLYYDVFLAGSLPKYLIWGSKAQDIISIPLALTLFSLSILFIKKPNFKGLIGILGLVWYFFYAYGLYTIQGQYTSIYVVYLTIFSLSIYSLLFGLLSFEIETVQLYILPKIIQRFISGFLISIIIFLGMGWLARMAPNIAKHVPEGAYGVYILDLCIVFPAFGITAALLLKNKPFGNILAGLALLKGFTLCLSWTFAEWTNPIQGITINIGMAALSTTLTTISLILFIPYMFKLKKGETNNG